MRSVYILLILYKHWHKNCNSGLVCVILIHLLSQEAQTVQEVPDIVSHTWIYTRCLVCLAEAEQQSTHCSALVCRWAASAGCIWARVLHKPQSLCPGILLLIQEGQVDLTAAFQRGSGQSGAATPFLQPRNAGCPRARVKFIQLFCFGHNSIVTSTAAGKRKGCK